MLDARQKLLLALYVEYQRKVPEPERITKEVLGIEYDTEFFAGLRKLEIEDLITGIINSNGNRLFDCVVTDMKHVSITKEAIQYIEELFKIKSYWSGENKIKGLLLEAKQNEEFESMFVFLDEIKKKLID